MIYIKNAEEIEKMRESNRIIAVVLNELKEIVQPGVSTYQLNKKAEEIIRDEGATPAFKGYSIPGLQPFPAALCTSVNSYIVHGIPSKKAVLKEGDIIGIDVGTYKNGYHGDGAWTYAVGEISDKTRKLLDVTYQALLKGIENALAGNRLGDISFAIGSHVSRNGYYVADNLTGHGIGRQLHEEPMIPNFGKKGRGVRLAEGMTLAIEPMVNIGTNRVLEKGWEYMVADGTLSAHFEHTILITDNKPEILTKIR